MQSLVAKASLYHELLQESLSHLAPAQQRQMQDSIAQIDAGLGGDFDIGPDGHNDTIEQRIGDEWKVLSSVGSPRLQDRHNRDRPGSTDETGYFGKTAVIRWLDDAEQKVAEEPSTSQRSGGVGESATTSATGDEANSAFLPHSYYQTNELDAGNQGEVVNQADLPPREIANALLECYFRTIHIVYPIVIKSEFVKQYDSLWSAKELPSAGLTWLAKLNMMLAIGVVGMQAMQQHDLATQDNHVKYFLRARLLQPEAVTMMAVPTLEHVQLQTLYGAYFLSLGLYLIDNTPNLTNAQSELQKRIWHTVSGLDLFVALLSGRPPASSPESVSTGMSSMFSGELSSDPQGSRANMRMSHESMPGAPNVMHYNIWLDRILSDVMSTLYSANMVRYSWAKLQRHTVRLNSLLDDWRSQLPPSYALDLGRRDHAPLPEQTYLTLRYFSTRMMINRPSVCATSSLKAAMPDQSEASVVKDRKAAALGVASAQALLRTFPRETDIVWVFQCTPWWCVLHYLVQAAAVLILEIHFRAVHVPEPIRDIIADARTALSWLSKIAETGHAAKKAWTVVSKLTLLALSKAGEDPFDLRPFMCPDVDSLVEGIEADADADADAEAGMLNADFENLDPSHTLPYLSSLHYSQTAQGDRSEQMTSPTFPT
ncbi:MAG: hypothetical protein Q9160_006780 [Pyrenula sp. 1 TL-2023]